MKTIKAKISPRPAAKKAGASKPGAHQSPAPGKLTKVPASSNARTMTLLDLDVLPPVRRGKPGAPMPLAEIEDYIRQIDARISERTRGFHNEVIYDIVEKGLMLLKGRELHLRQGQKALVETVSTSGKKPTNRALAKAEEKGEQGFLAWLGEKFEDQSTRTARNYMNAARNAGLTSDHALDDVQALRLSAALHEKKPTDLYRLAEPLKTPALPDEDAPTPNLVAEVTRDLFDYLDQTIQLRPTMRPDEYEAATQRMHASLESFTGQRWVMVEAADDSATHGQMHAATAHEKRWAKASATKKGTKRK